MELIFIISLLNLIGINHQRQRRIQSQLGLICRRNSQPNRWVSNNNNKKKNPKTRPANLTANEAKDKKVNEWEHKSEKKEWEEVSVIKTSLIPKLIQREKNRSRILSLIPERQESQVSCNGNETKIRSDFSGRWKHFITWTQSEHKNCRSINTMNERKFSGV